MATAEINSDEMVRRKLNLTLNRLEFEKRKVVLASTPEVVNIGAHNHCNAKCIWCLSGDYKVFELSLYKDFFEAKLGPVIRTSRHVSFVGFGEILWLPGIEQFLEYLNQSIPDVVKQFTTNGTPLKEKLADCMSVGRYSIRISLHAPNAELHEKITKIKDFDRIMKNLKYALKKRDEMSRRSYFHLELFNVLTKENIDALPDMVRLAKFMEVPRVECVYMTMFTKEHIPMSLFFDQERANRKLDEAQELADKLGVCIVLPPRFGKGSPERPGACSDPWQYFYVETQGSVLPCCYAGGHAGYIDKQSFEEIWNGEFYTSLRRSIAEGNPHPWCKNCVKYNGFNVNSLLCHITNRPETQKMIIEEAAKMGILTDQMKGVMQNPSEPKK